MRCFERDRPQAKLIGEGSVGTETHRLGIYSDIYMCVYAQLIAHIPLGTEQNIVCAPRAVILRRSAPIQFWQVSLGRNESIVIAELLYIPYRPCIIKICDVVVSSVRYRKPLLVYERDTFLRLCEPGSHFIKSGMAAFPWEGALHSPYVYPSRRCFLREGVRMLARRSENPCEERKPDVFTCINYCPTFIF